MRALNALSWWNVYFILVFLGSPQFSGVLTKAASRTCWLKVANPH